MMPCPFCQGTDVVDDLDTGICRGCYARGPTDTWNALGKRLEQLERIRKAAIEYIAFHRAVYETSITTTRVRQITDLYTAVEDNL